MQVFKVVSTYNDDYDYYNLEMIVFAASKEEAKQNFINKCKDNINELRNFVKHHSELRNKIIIEIEPCQESFEGYYDLTYVKNEHNNTYEDYLGYGKESAWFTPPKKTEENYKEYLEYKKCWTDAHEKFEKYKNDEEKQKEYKEYVKKREDEVNEINKKLLSNDFIFEFFSKLEIYIYEIKMNEFEIRRECI
jgi:hypothetical protein